MSPGRSLGAELLLDEGQEDIAVRRSVDVVETAPTVECDGADHGHRAPVAVSGLTDRLFTERSPAVVRRRTEPEALLVDEDQLRRIEVRLELDECFALRTDIRPVDFAGDFGPLLCVQPQSRTAFHIAVIPTRTPLSCCHASTRSISRSSGAASSRRRS
jgi:hypothetical protein